MTESERKKAASEAARLLRSVNSQSQQEAARRNGTLGGRPKGTIKPLEEIECTCGGEGLNHKAGCPRGRAIRRRGLQPKTEG